MNYKVVIGVIIALIIGLAVGYWIYPATVKPVTTIVTQTVSTTITKTVTAKAPITVVDALGREVRFEEVPKRVVSLAPSITEILWALDLGGHVVGVDKYSNYPPEVAVLVKEGKIAVVGGFWNPDLEKIVTLKPDLVLADAGARPQLRLLSKFKEAGLKVLYLKGDSSRDTYDIYSDIRLVARTFGVEMKADGLIKEIDEKLSYVKSELTKHNATRVKVLQLSGPPSWGLWTTGGGTFIDYVLTAAGGVNVAHKYHGWVQVSYEDVVSWNPAVIIITVMGVDPEKILNEIPSTPLNQTKASKTGNIYVFTAEAGNMLSRPGPRIGDAVLLVGKVLHPEIFGKVSRGDVVKLAPQTPAAFPGGIATCMYAKVAQ